ncbi:site-specific integrase [Sphingobacterium oryzagri]|uniref:Site-specific integrase n=1 Tax=Sphingobacterium oryzagri TaxID=3025669 RepID=A0ABY7WJA0_9SPHI|nr:site-specific integrase [Sphingobacterium sp. KACC 22765]WDF69590.1 site-specific integrase [Sphingobacterium sp. KACC 22765]
MKTQNCTFGVIFYLKKQKTTAVGTAPIYARVTVNGKRTEISVKRSISVSAWDVKKGLGKGSREEIAALNRFLARFKAKIIDAYQEMVLAGKVVDGSLIRARVTMTADSGRTLCELIDFHNKDQQTKLTYGTMKNYYTTQRYIKDFLQKRFRSGDVSILELNYAFISDFEHYLRDHKPKDHHRPLNNNGVMKHIERLRKMVNMAVTMDWLTKDPFAKFRKHFDKVERNSLTKEQLTILEGKCFRIERLAQVLDMFLFSCYTGLAYIDLTELTPDSIRTGIDGELWIYTNRIKTDTSVRIPLLPKAKALMEKYQNDPRAINNGTVFPVISNQRMNGYLKEIAEICEIDNDLTFHIARHTFATTVTLSNGVPIESVSKMLGHTSIRTTQIYAKVVEKKLSDDMQKLKVRLSAAT